MDYKESQESKNLVKLNQDYMDVFYSRPYQKYVNRKVRKLTPKTVFDELKTGYFIGRIGHMISGGAKQPSYAASAVKRNGHRGVDTSERVAIYTVIIGNYDTLKQPLYVSEQCDYFVLSDHDIDTTGTAWTCKNINSIFDGEEFKGKQLSNTKKARYVKTHPHVFFKEYRYSIFIDGNFLIVADLVPLVQMLGENSFATHLHPSNDCIYKEAKGIIALGKSSAADVNEQVEVYRNEGFPEHYGLFETNVLVREHNTPVCITIDEAWWHETDKYKTLRDQLSLTYVLWKYADGMASVNLLGNNPRKNPRLRYYSHI